MPKNSSNLKSHPYLLNNPQILYYNCECDFKLEKILCIPLEEYIITLIQLGRSYEMRGRHISILNDMIVDVRGKKAKKQKTKCKLFGR